MSSLVRIADEQNTDEKSMQTGETLLHIPRGKKRRRFARVSPLLENATRIRASDTKKRANEPEDNTPKMHDRLCVLTPLSLHCELSAEPIIGDLVSKG
jgi:hypothetical protein